MNLDQRGVAFQCHGDWLYGVLSLSPQPSDRGVVFVVGGPQYRIGSHRQFTLLSRHLAAHGVPSLRFDYRGMGDSDGMARTFESVDDDIRAAIDHFFTQVPSLREVVLWGLCDGASASLFYADKDERIRGLVLLNPWVRTEQGAAKVYLRHYYARRLFNIDFWNKVLRGRFDYRTAASAVCKMVGTSMKARTQASIDVSDNTLPEEPLPLPDRMLQCLARFRGKTLFIISGNDLTAQEFNALTKSNRLWQRALSSNYVQRRDLTEANHTFAQCNWRDQVAEWTRQWTRSW